MNINQDDDPGQRTGLPCRALAPAATTTSQAPHENTFQNPFHTGNFALRTTQGESTMPPQPPQPSAAQREAAEAHQALLDKLDIANVPKPFKNPNWKPSQRRNKSIKQILAEEARRGASVLATQNNSGATTPAIAGTATPNTTGSSANIEKASQSLGQLVLERNLAIAAAASNNAATDASISVAAGQSNGGGGGGGPVTYSNIEAPPSLLPIKKYCDVTGLPAKYRDPKTGLRYYNKEIFQMIRKMPPGVPEQYLAARNAHTILK